MTFEMIDEFFLQAGEHSGKM